MLLECLDAQGTFFTTVHILQYRVTFGRKRERGEEREREDVRKYRSGETLLNSLRHKWNLCFCSLCPVVSLLLFRLFLLNLNWGTLSLVSDFTGVRRHLSKALNELSVKLEAHNQNSGLDRMRSRAGEERSSGPEQPRRTCRLFEDRPGKPVDTLARNKISLWFFC